MPLGLYISVPFCRSKCTYCNFASGVFSRTMFARYVDRICADLARAPQTAAEMGGEFERQVDSVYLGGGTPTVLSASDLDRLFHAVRQNFNVLPEAEITVECAPGTLNSALLEAMLRWRVNRVSLGIQSFVDEEAAAVGRLHTRSTILNDITRLRLAGIHNINLDLIAGLPHQTRDSWRYSLAETIATAVPHVSVYMLEVDDESRLGRELIAGGTRYHAHFVPDEDATADFYLEACDQLNAAGISQYEISNFARSARESRHNLKYWTRQPYLGFGVDAHSMLQSATDLDRCNPEGAAQPQLHCHPEPAAEPRVEGPRRAVRFSTPDSLDDYVAAKPLLRTPVSSRAALEETFFLGLRLVRGVDLSRLDGDALQQYSAVIAELHVDGLLELDGPVVRLTARGRLLSNEVFQRFIGAESTMELPPA